MDFIYLFRVILKRKWLIIATALLAVGIAYIFTRNQEKKYYSSTLISTGYTVSDEIKISNNDNFSIYEADTKFNNVIVTATSETVVSLLSYSMILHDMQNPVPFTNLSQEKKRSTVYREVDPQKAISTFQTKLETMTTLSSFKPDEKLLLEFLKLYGYDYKSIAKELSVYRLQHTDYMQIEYTSANPELSAYVVNNLFQQFLRSYKGMRSTKSQESIDTLQSLLEKKKQILDEKNRLLQNEGGATVGAENTSKLSNIENLETSLTEEKNKQTKQEYDLQKINQRIAEYNKNGGTTTNSTPDNKNNDDLLTLRRQKDDAYAAYLNSGSQDEELLKKYNALKADYDNKVLAARQDNTNTAQTHPQELSKVELLDKKTDLKYDIQASTSNINSMQDRINALRGGLSLDASKSAAVASLLKDAELANKEYLDAKQKYNDATDINSASVTNFRQVQPGQPAIEPEPSKRILIIGMAGVSVVIITMLVIILMAYLDSSIKTPDIFSRIVNLKLIGMVNFMNLKQKSLADLVVNRNFSLDPLDRNKLNVFRESLRKLRYEIEMSGKKIFLFTSTKKGEGKTTLIQALSYSMSMSKKKILIIDTNFCNNDLTVALHADPILEKIHPNMIDNNNRTLLEQVRNAAKEVGVGTVFAIGSEGGDYTPSEILPRENLLKHLQALTQDYDFIFLEGPPLNDFSDSKELAQFAEGIIAIFSATNMIKQIDKQSMAFFRELNGKFTGAILNKVDLQNVNVS